MNEEIIERLKVIAAVTLFAGLILGVAGFVTIQHERGRAACAGYYSDFQGCVQPR
jgi:hypothetical protein